MCAHGGKILLPLQQIRHQAPAIKEIKRKREREREREREIDIYIYIELIFPRELLDNPISDDAGKGMLFPLKCNYEIRRRGVQFVEPPMKKACKARAIRDVAGREGETTTLWPNLIARRITRSRAASTFSRSPCASVEQAQLAWRGNVD